MSSKAELNCKIQSLQQAISSWRILAGSTQARCDDLNLRLAKANQRLAQRRNGFWRRVWLRAKAILKRH